MRPFFSYSLILSSLFVVIYFALNYPDIRHTIKDQAASVYQPDSGLEKDEEKYISLIDIITTSLNHIKNAVNTVTTDTSKSSNIPETKTSSSTPTADLADAIVNILCTYETNKYRQIISGTGFMISKEGAILTNAHVAQFLLLKNSSSVKDATCTVRISNEASDTYPAGLLYISPTWVIEHADRIASQNPRGSGENDFALLYVASTEESAPIFPFVAVSVEPLKTDINGHTVILVGYPSSEEEVIKKDYSRKVATTTITNIYTFGRGSADVISLSESILGYGGASGGPVIDHSGRAIGVISTKDRGTTALNAITTAYIDHRMREETGFDLMSTIQGNLPARAKLFNETVSPILGEILNQSLD